MPLSLPTSHFPAIARRAGLQSWSAWGPGWLSLKVVAGVHLAGGFAILSFLIVHLYMITTGHNLGAHTRAMICGWEEVEDRVSVDEWEIKARVVSRS